MMPPKNRKVDYFAMKVKEKKVKVKDPILATPDVELEKLIEAAIQEPPVIETKLQAAPERVYIETSKAPVIPQVEKKTLDNIKQQAYNVHYHSKLKKFMLVTIEFDLVTGFSQVVGNEPWADSWPVAIEKLRNKIALILIRGENRV